MRRLIIDEMAVNPKYYEKMSELLDALILQRKQGAMDYKEYLAEIVSLAKEAANPETGASYPASIDSAPLRALFDNLEKAQPDADAREAKALAPWTAPSATPRETVGAATYSRNARCARPSERNSATAKIA